MTTPTHLFILILAHGQELVARLVAAQLPPLPEAVCRQASGPPQATYLTTAQTLAYLHLTKPTLNKLRRQKLVVSLQCSDNRVLYERDQLDAYLQSRQPKGGRHV